MLSPGEADRYAHLEVRFVPGHNPDLVVTTDSDGVPLPAPVRHDLTRYNRVEDMHALVMSTGFARRAAGEAQDRDSNCAAWRDKGECLRNPTFMSATCALACRDLADRSSQCAAWAAQGECGKNPRFMYGECPVACGWKNEL